MTQAKFFRELDVMYKNWGGMNAATNLPWRVPKYFPGDYTVALTDLVDDMLRYRPENRPSLNKLYRRISDLLEKMDRRYQNVFESDTGNLLPEFQIGFQARDDGFTLGQEFVPQKRRRIVPPQEERAGPEEVDYRRIVEEWNSGSHSRWDRAELASAWQELERKARDAARRGFYAGETDQIRKAAAFRALAVIRKRVDPSSPQDQLQISAGTDWPDGIGILGESVDEALGPRNTLWALRRIRITVRALIDRPATPLTMVPALRVLRHAVEWGAAVLQMAPVGNHESLTPKIEERHLSPMHQGVLDLIYHDPSAVPGQSD